MRRMLAVLLVPAALASVATLPACDRHVEEHTKTTTDESGRQKTEKTTVTQDRDTGDTTVKKEKTVTPP